MRQHLLKKQYDTIFASNQMPWLSFFYKIYGSHDTKRFLHSHNNVTEFTAVIEGTCSSLVGGFPILAQPGDIIIMNSGISHQQDWPYDPTMVVYSVGIQNLHIKGMRENSMIADNIPPVFSAKADFDVLINLLDLMFDLLEGNRPQASETCNYLLTSVIMILLNLQAEDKLNERAAPPDSKQDLILSVCHYLDENYNRPLSLDDIAAYARTDKYHLSHIFKDAIGISPINYLIQCRIGEAQTLLVETDQNVSEICSAVGFNSISHFDKLFLKYTNMSPLLYRKRTLDSYPKQKFQESV